MDIITDFRFDDIPHSCFIKSSENAYKIAYELKVRTDKESKFFITEITNNCDGFITENIMLFILKGIKNHNENLV